MTHLLDHALERVRELTPEDQDAIAAIILDELEDERAWDEQFAATQTQLSRVADKVRQDISAGRVREFEVDEL